MIVQLIAWISAAWDVLRHNIPWMAWNLFLALVPLVLSFRLFRQKKAHVRLWWIVLLLVGALLPNLLIFIAYNRTNYIVWAVTAILIALDFSLLRSRSRSFRWWVGFLVFIAFLPNAPYVLTDIIHLIDAIRLNHSVWVIALVLIPQYLLFILGGFEAYVLSLINLGHYLQRQGWGKFVLWTELSLHALSAVGIYLGRFKRFNSWDFVTQPSILANTLFDDLVAKRPAMVMVVTFVTIASLYWLMKQVSLGIILRAERQAIAKEQTPNSNSQQTQS